MVRSDVGTDLKEGYFWRRDEDTMSSTALSVSVTRSEAGRFR